MVPYRDSFDLFCIRQQARVMRTLSHFEDRLRRRLACRFVDESDYLNALADVERRARQRFLRQQMETEG